MKIVIELEKDNYDKKKVDMTITDTEDPTWKWIEIDGEKYAILTKDLICLSNLIKEDK